MDDTFTFGAAVSNRTNLHPIMAVLLLVLCVMAMRMKRNRLILPFLICLNFTTYAQRLTVASIDFPLLRIVLVVVLARLVLKGEFAGFRLNRMDRLVLLFAAATAGITAVRGGGFSSVIYAMSSFADTIGAYLVVRTTIREEEDVLYLAKVMMWISFFIAVLFIVERLTGRNPMGIFGGVRAITWIREGKLRVQGPYPHPILAGAYWAATFPLLMALHKQEGSLKRLVRVSLVCAALIVVLCASSTPLISLLVAIMTCLFYYQRESRNFLKVCAVAVIVVLMAVWSHPIWYLFTKIDFTGGSTGYFRYLLIDAFMRNWRDWVFLGITDTGVWGASLGLASVGLSDIANQFVLQGARGGIIGLVLFILVIVRAFDYIGRALRAETSEGYRFLVWCVGAALVAHIFNFMGVSYFGTTEFSWWMTLAISSSLYQARAAEAALEPGTARPASAPLAGALR